MKKFFVLILAILSTSVLSQQNYNSLKVKDFTNTNTAVFNTLLNGVAKLNAGVLSASPIVNADVSAGAAISFSKLSGVVDTSTAQNISGNKSFLDNFSVTGTTTLATSLSGYLKATAGVVSSVSQVDLSTDVVGTLPITNGGTGSTSKSWVDLTTNQSGIAGNKAFTGNISTSGILGASNLSGTNTGDLLTQSQNGSQTTTSTLEAPYEQLTTTATRKTLIETGYQNVLRDPGAEGSAVAWSSYADAAGVLPVDGTGGSPTITATYSTTAPLAGKSSLILTKTAVNSQGQGISIPFTISPNMTMKVIRLSFDYSVLSGTYADDQVEFFVHDITNNTIKPFTPSKLKNHSLVSEKFNPNGEYQTSNSVSYRLIAHIAGTSASAYSLKFDEFKLGVYEKTYGSVVVDVPNYTPILSTNNGANAITLTGTGALTPTGFSISSAGSYLKMSAYIQNGNTAATGTAGQIEMTLPPGIVADLSNYPLVGQIGRRIGEATYFNGTTYIETAVRFVSANRIGFYKSGTNQTLNLSDLVGNAAIYFNDISIPVVGRSSSQVMSSDASTRVVAASSDFKLATGTLNASYNLIKIPAGTVDTHGAYNATTGEYTVAVSGLYEINLYVETSFASASDSAGVSVGIYKNGSGSGLYGNNYIARATVGNITATKNGLLELVAGDKITFYAQSGAVSPTFTSSATGSGFNIRLLQGPAQIAASESVSAIYTTSSGQVIPNNLETVFNYNTKLVDTHNAVTVGANWKFTAPISGQYLVSAYALFAPNSTGVREIFIFRNSVADPVGSGRLLTIAQGTISTTVIVNLLAGETLFPSIYQNSGGSLAVEGTVWRNKISIIRVGNY